MKPNAKNWFETWFSTHYYDVLYQHRDEEEAAAFINALLAYLRPAPGASMLDIACGKGRHATLLSEKGFEVTGIDLSFKSIREARVNENERLSFFQHDMRNIFRINYFDFIFNFYTSFGYFEQEKEDIDCLRSFAAGLKPGGKLIIDFFNINYILQHMVEDESKFAEGIQFQITKSFVDGFLIKQIIISDQGEEKKYVEKVKGISLDHFKQYLAAIQLHITDIFGNYQLAPFDPATSERLIIIAQK